MTYNMHDEEKNFISDKHYLASYVQYFDGGGTPEREYHGKHKDNDEQHLYHDLDSTYDDCAD